MSVFICDEDTSAVLAKFCAGFYVSNKVSFQNYFANKPIKWFVFEAVKTIEARVLNYTERKSNVKFGKYVEYHN